MPIGGTPEQLTTLRNNYQTATDNFQASLQSVQTAVEQVDAVWFGHQNQRFNTDHETWAGNMNQFNTGLSSVSEAVGSVSTGYVTLDA